MVPRVSYGLARSSVAPMCALKADPLRGRLTSELRHFTWANFVLSTMRKDSPCSLQQTRLSDAGDETISKSLMRKGATCARQWHSRGSGTGVSRIGGFRGNSRLNQSGGRRALCQQRLLVVEATRSFGW